MRGVSFFLTAVIVALTLLTAAWRSRAAELGAANYRLEREIDALERMRDDAREKVWIGRQPLSLRDRRDVPAAEPRGARTVEVAKADRKPPKRGAPARRPAPRPKPEATVAP